MAPGATQDGREAVLKIVWPHPEAASLRHWAGRGAAALYALDTEHFALLLEACSPGTALSTAGLARKRPWRRAPRCFIGCGARSPHGDVGPESITDVAEKWCLEAEER
ncbi:aminoglycoside phosphotransferase family protein [Streptomyces sp. NPDC059256]|uniref:aminoglycoside phosphotransferase family protein n=1 Tax=Streptomyces sp. NPDC059256 TaxID=3346794 RepID=UPI0036ACAB3E